jgi:hypothetical protein
MSQRLQLATMFNRFSLAAEREGAQHVEGVCRGRRVEFTGEKTVAPTYTIGCNGESLFDLPAEGAFKKPDPARICVVDDMAYLFPKYDG